MFDKINKRFELADESPKQFTKRVMGDLQSFIKEVEKDQLPGETLADTIKRINLKK